LPGRRAMRSSPERRRAAVWLHTSVRRSRVGTRHWCGGDSCPRQPRASAGAAVPAVSGPGGCFAATGTAEVANGCSANRSAEVGIVGIGVWEHANAASEWSPLSTPRSACVRRKEWPARAVALIASNECCTGRLPRLPAGADLSALCAPSDRRSARLSSSR
jgi:hypothetical protein